MDNQKCILVKFSNDKSTSVGYVSWLICDQDEKSINKIISDKKEVIIDWPDCEITSSVKFMNKQLENATFKKL